MNISTPTYKTGMNKVYSFFKNKRNLLLVAILLLASFLRLYMISDYMTFLGDEGRDVMVAKDILQGHFTLLGPRASAADFYTGPIYYYFMAPFLWLFHLDPVGPAIGIALLGIVSVFLVYYVSKYFFSERAGLFAAALYAVSPLVISYSRSSWNPNPMPFMSLVLILLLYKAVLIKSWKLFLLSGLLFGIAFQLHYIEVFFGITIFLFVTVVTIIIEKKEAIKNLFLRYLQFFSGFLIGFSPFLAFEIRHDFPNLRTVVNFIYHQENYIQEPNHTTPFQVISDVFFRLFARLLSNYPPSDQVHNFSSEVLMFWQIGIVLLAIASVYALFRVKNKITVLLFALWLFIGVVCFGFYRKPIYDYYFEFMFPLPFHLLGNLLSQMYHVKKFSLYGKILAVVLFTGFFLYNLYWMPFRFPANRQKDQVKAISEFIISKTDNKPFNFALLTTGNSDHAYRYYFDILGHSPVTIENMINDPQRKSVTSQLMIICEDIKCKPLGNSLWEVAGFGRAEIAGIWNVSVVKVYRLVQYKGK